MAVAWMVDDSHLLYVIKHELKDHGVKIGKLKGNARTNSSSAQNQDKDGSSPVFGVSLANLPCCKDLQTGLEIPRFVRECVDFLSSHLKEEGLFRKSGSHARQKQLQVRLSEGEPIPTDCLVADVASILKRFLRDLPEPIIPPRYQSVIIKCISLDDEIIQEWTFLLILCLLPFRNIQLLRYIMIFLGRVSANSVNNKMDATNLAKVLMPTIMGARESGALAGKNAQVERQIRLKTLAMEIMIRNAKAIGVVPDTLLDRMRKVKTRSIESLEHLTSEDELERSSDDNLDPRIRRKSSEEILDPRIRRKKRRSGTLQGIVSGLGSVGYKVGVLRKPSGSQDNLDQTPEDSLVTPRTPRSVKRKASEDIGWDFSAKKRMSSPNPRGSRIRGSLRTRRKSSPLRRKATMQQTTTEAQFRKRGSLKSDPSSPMTPLQPAKPPIGEVDAVDSAGETVFHFNTPSIKFADDSFSGFTSPPTTTSEGPAMPAGITPRRNKLKKLNPLNSRRFKRKSLGPSGGRTPHKLSVNKQVHPYNDSRASTHVGHRLANEPYPEGLDTLHLVPRHPECREELLRCPGGEAKEVPSAGMYTPPLYLRQDAKSVDCIGKDGQDGEMTAGICHSSEATHINEAQSFENLYEGGAQDVRRGDSNNVRSSVNHVSRFPDITSSLCTAALDSVSEKLVMDRQHGGRVTTPAMYDHAMDWDCGELQGNAVHPLQYRESQRSLSSILSNVTVQSTKSYFSIEAAAVRCDSRPSSSMDDARDIEEATLTISSLDPDRMDVSELQDESVHNETQSEPTLACSHPISRSLQSLDSTPSKAKTAEWILKKTISVDSGRGASLEDLETPRQGEQLSQLTAADVMSHAGDARKETSCIENWQENLTEVTGAMVSSKTTPDIIEMHVDLTPQAVVCQGSNFTKVNPSKLRPFKVGHDDSSMRQFLLMQERIESQNTNAKSVRQKIHMFNSLSKEDISRSGRGFGPARRVRHHSGSDLPSCEYTKQLSGGYLGTPRGCELPVMSLSPLVKSVSHDTGLSELGRRQVKEVPKTPSLPRKAGFRRPSYKSSGDEDFYESVMSSAAKVVSKFKQLSAEHSTPVAERRPLEDKNISVANHAKPSPVQAEALEKENMGTLLSSSPSFGALVSPRRVQKQLKRLHSEENKPGWQRHSPRRAFTRDNYMHRLKSPRGHHGSPRHPLERRTSKRSRPVRKEWQV